MKTRNRKNGYSATTAKQYIDQKQAIHCLSTEFEAQIKFEDGNQRVRLSATKLGSLRKDYRLFK